MNSRLNLTDSLVSRWQFPMLELDRKPPPPVAAAGPPCEPVAAQAAEPEPAAPDPEAIAAMVGERIKEGYAEGLRRGYAEGREQGYAAGVAAVQAERDRAAAEAARLAAIVERLGTPIDAVQRAAEEATVALALEVARCVIGSEVGRSHEYLVRLIREAIAKVPIEMGAPRVLLNPDDLDLVRALAPDIESNRVALVADGAVEPGGCLVVADGDDTPAADRRWHPRAGEGVSQVDLTLASRWRSVILALFEGEED